MSGYLSSVGIRCRPVGISFPASRVNAHESLEVAAKRVGMLLYSRDEVVAPVSQKAAQSHLKRCHVASDLVVGCLFQLDPIGKEKVAEILK